MKKIDFKAILTARNRGILLDVVVFFVNVLFMHALTLVSLNLVRDAEFDNQAKFLVGLFFAGVFLLQPLGPTLKRWSFHQRFKRKDDSLIGCLVFPLAWFHIVMMILLVGTATILLSEVFFEPGSPGSEFGGFVIVAGAGISFVNAFLIYRYFYKPKKEPRWKFLMTPQAAVLGDVLMFLNVICLQIIFNGVSASRTFWSVLISTPLGGESGTVTEIVGRFIVIGALAMLAYFPPRIFYLVEDKNRKITWLTMFIANLPLIIRAVFASKA